MRFHRLVENEPEMIGPEDEESLRRSDAILEIENRWAQKYFVSYQKAGIELFSDEGIPVNVTFYEEEQMVEIYVTTDDSFTVQALIKLSEAGMISPATEISAHKGEITIRTQVPARGTEFEPFLTGTVSVGTASSSGSV